MSYNHVFGGTLSLTQSINICELISKYDLALLKLLPTSKIVYMK